MFVTSTPNLDDQATSAQIASLSFLFSKLNHMLKLRTLVSGNPYFLYFSIGLIACIVPAFVYGSVAGPDEEERRRRSVRVPPI